MRENNINLRLKGYALILGITVAVLVSPWVASASVLSSQLVNTADFAYPGTSSNTGYATSTDFTVLAGTNVYSAQMITSPISGATTTTMSLLCNGADVADWIFDLTGETEFSMYLQQKSTPEQGVVHISTQKTCHVQFITGDNYNGPLQDLPRNVKTSGIAVNDVNGNPTLASSPYYIISSDQTLSGNALVINVTPPDSSISTTSLATFCDSNVPYDNSNIVQATITAIPNGLCRVGSFLIVPSSSSLSQFSTLSDTLRGKIPFSYFYDVSDLYNGSTASSTQNMQSFTMSLGLIDFASSTSMGAMLPASVNFLSSTTISTFLPAGMHDLLYNMMIYAIWIEVMYLLYHRIVPNKAKI